MAFGVMSPRPWKRMERKVISMEARAASARVNDPMDEVWANDLYDCQVRYLEPQLGRSGPVHLSIKRMDRNPIRDWRHMQAIKNEVIGSEREAVEVFPRESRLVDGSNQYHLWVMPEGVDVPLGFGERAVGTDADMRRKLRRLGIDPGKARQRDWQPGISTGPNYRGQ